MPTFDTGQANWNEALGGIAGVLFPDQSKEAAAYYHGALARKAQLEGNKAISEQNAMTYLPNILSGQQPNYSYRPAQLTGASPILQPAQNLPGVAVGVQPPALSSAFIPSPQVVTQAAVNTPGAVAPFTRGTPPAYVSPAPGSGAPPAPTSTTSNGQRPADEVGSGPVHPATFNQTPGQGGSIKAGPAASNGSNAQPMINAAQYALAQSMAGVPEPVIKTNISTYFGQLHAQGSITDRQYYDQLASVGITTPLTQTIGEAGATTRQGMADKAALERANVQAAAQRYSSDIGLRTPGTYTDAQGNIVTMTPTQALATPGNIKVPGSATEAQGYAAGRALALPPGPGRQAALSDVYSLGTSAQTYGPYNTGGATTTMAAGTAATTPGARPEPTSEAQQIGRVAARASDPNATPEQRQQASNELANLQAALAKGKPPDQNQLFQQQMLNYQQNNRAYAATRQDANQMPVYVPPDVDVAIRNRAAQLMSDERLGFRDHPDQAYNQARQELINNNTIEGPKDIAEKRKKLGGLFASWNSSPDVTTIQPPGAPADAPATQHIIVGFKNKDPSVSGAMTTPQPGATAPPPTPGATPPVPTGPTPAPAGGTGGATIKTPSGQGLSLGASLGPAKAPVPPDFTQVMVGNRPALVIGGQIFPIVGQ